MAKFDSLMVTAVFASLLVTLIDCAELRIPVFGLAKVPPIFDSVPANNVSIKQIAERICSDKSGATKEQISRVSTILKLDQFFSNSAELDSDKLRYCAERYSKVLADLRKVVEQHNKNVCSDEKIELIEGFHRNYVSNASEDVEKRPAIRYEHSAPEVLKLFFMHYAMEISAVCRRALITNLEWDLKDKFHEDEYEFGKDSLFNKLMDRMSTNFSPVTSINDYDDVLLIWDLIQEDSAEELDEVTGEPIKLLIKTKSVDQLRKIQDKCRCKFRPYYEKLIMPIIMLADIGYSCSGERFERELHELRENQLVKRWYGITQVCEAILPMKFYQDDSLAEEEVVIISKEEATLISKQQVAHSGSLFRAQTCPEAGDQYEPTTNSMNSTDRLDSVATVEAQELVSEVNLKTSMRQRAVKRAYRRLLKNIAEKKTRHLYYSHKVEPSSGDLDEAKVYEKRINPDGGSSLTDANGFVKEGLQERLDEIKSDSLTDEDLLSSEGGFGRKPNGHIKRNKCRPRPGDVNLLEMQKKDILSYKHTKSLSEIMNNFLDSIAPRKRTMILFGTILIGALVLAIVLAV